MMGANKSVFRSAQAMNSRFAIMKKDKASELTVILVNPYS
jgi:hypothetical protein